MNRRLKIAIKAAKQAGEVIRKNFRGDFEISTKRNERDLVTTIDTAADKKILQLIKNNFPQDAILSEETQKDALNSESLWLIDPLDGTTNFVAGLPIFCISIAYAYKGEIKLGVVYHPILNELYLAQREKKAYLIKKDNGKKIELSVTNSGKLIKSLISFDYSSVDLYRNDIQRVTSSLPKEVRGMRILGSAALEFAWVAAGFSDAYLSRGAHPWDVAAGILLVEEAGGKITDWKGNPTKLDDRNFLASNGRIHQELLNKIKVSQR